MVDYWEETIQLLQPASGNQLVTKPQLKPDLLQKVPFKFLHDVITAILRKTNFAAGLYSDEQLNRKWDGYDKEKVGRDANQNRRKFLSNMLLVVSQTLDEDIQCDVKEVLRGKNAEGANKLLQSLAKAAHILNLDGSEAVQMLKRNDDGHTDAEAQRPESRRAPKPTRVTESEVANTPASGQPDAAKLEPLLATSSEAPYRQVNKFSGTNKTGDVDRARVPSHGDVVEQPVFSNATSTPASLSGTSGPPQHMLESRTTNNSHGATETAATTPAMSNARPLTAKKAPPPAGNPAQVKQRSRLRPAQETAASTGRHGVRVYQEDRALDEDSVDVVETSASVQSSNPNMAHGVLVNEIYKAKNVADAVQKQHHDDTDGMVDGIHLGRSKRSKTRTATHVDFGYIQQAVEKVVQQITPLARAMEYLQEDKENMQKELQQWRSEAETWGEQLEEELCGHGLLDKAPMALLNEQIQSRKLSIKQMQRKILENNETISRIVNLVIGDT